MKPNEVEIGKIYYIVIYDCAKKRWEILCRKIEMIEPISNGLVFCHYKDGGVSNDYVFNVLLDAVGKQNRLNLMLTKVDRGIFYNGRIIWVKNGEYGLIKSIITDINWGAIVPTLKVKAIPNTEFSRNNPDCIMSFNITEVNEKFTLIPYMEETRNVG